MKNASLEIICALLAFLFIYASASKLLDYNYFMVQLSKSPFIYFFASTIAWFVPAIEIITAVMLCLKPFKQAGLYASLFLMTLFTSYLVAMLQFSYYIPCSCGGVLSFLSWKQHIFFNLFFLTLSFIGIYLLDQKHSHTPLLKSSR